MSFLGDLFSQTRSPARYRFENKSPKNFLARDRNNNVTNYSPLTVHRSQINETAFSRFTTHFSPFQKPAFTMAEVLITLGVIGIVAAMTIPNLVKKWEERAIIGKYKKMYSTLANAYNMAIVEYGDPANWVLADREEFLKRLEPYLNVTERCYYKRGCTSEGKYVSLSGELMWDGLYDTNTLPKLRLGNGFSIVMNGKPYLNCVMNYTNPDGSITPIENTCASMYVIITNTKSANYKNYFGKDFFSLAFTRQGVYPTGYNLRDTFVKASCSKDKHGNGNGDTCGTWILRYDNMDYFYK